MFVIFYVIAQLHGLKKRGGGNLNLSSLNVKATSGGDEMQP